MYTSTRSLVHVNKSSSHDRQVAPVPGHHLLLDLGPGAAPALGRRRFGSLEATLVPGGEGLRAERERGALAPVDAWLAHCLAELEGHEVLLPELGRHPGGELLGVILVETEQDLCVLGDARSLPPTIAANSVNVVCFSPPYPNRYDYTANYQAGARLWILRLPR
jgi:hypothetical protein